MTAATALSNAGKELTGKKKTAETAKKNLDTLVSTKQKPAMTAAAKAATDLTTAMTNKTAAEPHLISDTESHHTFVIFFL